MFSRARAPLLAWRWPSERATSVERRCEERRESRPGGRERGRIVSAVDAEKKNRKRKIRPFSFMCVLSLFFQLLLFFSTSGLFPPRPSRLSTIHCKFEFDFDFDAHRRVELLFQCSLFVHRGGGRRRETEASFCCRRVSSILFASRPCCSPPSLSRLRRAQGQQNSYSSVQKGQRLAF